LIGGGGTYAVTPLSRFVWGGSYENGLIWRNRWTTDDAVIECREALALPAASGRAVLLRRITARKGSARVRVVLDLRARFGARGMERLRRRDDGAWTARVGETVMI
jgi:alpha,alpha-trehalase